MNNYDKGSSGDNLELNISYDNDVSQIYFNDWLQGAYGTEVNRIDLGGRDNYLYLIGDSDAPYYKKSVLTKMNKTSLWQLFNDYDLGYGDITDFKKSELIDELRDLTILKHYKYLASQYSWGSIQNHITHDYFISRGYCQGDAVLIVSIECMTTEYKNYINHLFWDDPVYISIIVNDHEYREYDLINDTYDYDKGELKEVICKLDITDYAKSWLCNNLPDYPS